MPATPAADAARRERVVGGLAGCLTFVALLVSLWGRCFPPVEAPLSLTITFPAGVPERGEPLITTGSAGDADFLAVRYVDENTAVLVYDVWGVGGPTSEPFALRTGVRRALEVTMPTLAHVAHFRSHEKRPLRVVLDGRELLRDEVHFHRRGPAEIFFALNPCGGGIAAESFRGKLELPSGRELRGGPSALFGWTERARWMLSHRLGRIAWHALLSLCVGFATIELVRGAGRARAAARSHDWDESPGFPLNGVAPHRWFVATAAICTLAFSAVVTGGSFRFIHAEAFGNFYDHQAASLLQGRLDVPGEALSGEAFVFEGKNYGYFGPTPALLRIPFVLAKVGFGQLSRIFLTVYYVVSLVAVYALLIHVARMAGTRMNWPARFDVVLFTAMTGLGTTLFFLSSRAYIYHEAILCGVAFALWGSYFSLRFLDEPGRRWWIGALACGVLSVHARPPVGLFALSMLGCAALAFAWQMWRSELRLIYTRALVIAGLAGLGVLSFNGLSYLKFRSFEGAPLRYHVQYHPARLATIESRNFHAANFRFNFDGYVWRPDFELRPTFPYFFLIGHNSSRYRGARMDLVEPVTAMPYTMPALVFLAVVGGAFAFARWPKARWPLGVIAGATAPMALALFTAVALSQRYTADFCPALLLAGAFGLQAFTTLDRRWRRAMRATLAALTLASVLITLAITLHYQGEGVWGVPDETRQRYQTLKNAVDGLFGTTRHER